MAFEELKERHRVVWGAAPFEQIAPQIAGMHDALVEALGPRQGERWLDLGTGTGEVAFRAAAAGARVTASDLSPTLIETAEGDAARRGLEIDFAVADAEQLPYGDASFDVVSSSVGVVFAPDHGAVARELARVCAPGGRLGLTAWSSDMRVGVGAMFRAMSAFQPPPPPEAGSPFSWGDEAYVERLLGDAFDLRVEVRDSPQRGASGEEIWQLFESAFGPARVLADSLEPGRREELRRTMAGFFEQFRSGDGIEQHRPYLLVTGTRR